ncbi:MAG: SdpI family protein [Actinomycetaceae bacterium]|nr:SdpI family protein [Actinomycetaceae bacterium]
MQLLIASLFGAVLLVLGLWAFYLALAAERKNFVPGSKLGFRTRALMHSETTWREGHFQARPFFIMGAVIAVMNLFAILSLAPSLRMSQICIMGPMLCVIVLGIIVTGGSAANKHARQVLTESKKESTEVRK